MWFLRRKKEFFCGFQKNLDYRKDLSEINRNLIKLNNKEARRKEFIISIFIIPAFFWLYNFIIETSNYFYWFFLNKNHLGFLSSPIETPLIKIYMAILLIFLGGICFLNLTERDERVRLMLLAVNTLLVLVPYFFLLAFLRGGIDMDVDKFSNGESLLKLIFLNKKTVYILIGAIIVSAIIIFIVKRNSFFFCIVGVVMFLLSVLVIYMTYQYLSLHQSFATKSFKESANYIHLEGYSSTENHFILHCESKCFGYLVINKDSGDYELKAKVFNSNDIKYFD